MFDHQITPGLKYILEKEVGISDTGANLGPDALDYMLSTPALAAMVIEASLKLLNPLVPQGGITVGKQVELVHEAPTLVGETVHVELTVKKVVGSHIHLAVRAWDKMGEIAHGTHERIVVDRERLMSDAYERAGNSRT